MKNRINDKTYHAVEYMEMAVAVLVAISICAAVLYLVKELVVGLSEPSKIAGMTNFIEDALTVAVGIEFAKLLCKHKASNVVEVLIFAVARHMVGEHTTMTENLLCILCVAILFAVRKYMFHAYDEVEKTVFLPAARVKAVNQACAVHIPYKNEDDTLLTVFMDRYDQNQNCIMKGTCVFFHGVAIRVAKYRNDEIMELEIIRSVNSDVAHHNLS